MNGAVGQEGNGGCERIRCPANCIKTQIGFDYIDHKTVISVYFHIPFRHGNTPRLCIHGPGISVLGISLIFIYGNDGLRPVTHSAIIVSLYNSCVKTPTT